MAPRPLRALPRTPVRRLLPTALPVVLTVAVVAPGCSSGDDGSPRTTTTTSPAVSSTAAPAPSSSTSSSTTSTTTTTTSTTTTTLPPTTTTEPIVTTGAIVLVANGSSVPGAAGRLAAALTKRGFTVDPAVNAAGPEATVETTHIYAVDLTDPVARSVSRLMGDVPVMRMPTPLPVESGSPGDATVVVMLGKDMPKVRLLDL